jgi:hypothetical protein
MIRVLVSALVATAVLTASAAASPSAWKASSIERRAGPVSATFSYERRLLGGAGFEYRKLKLVVENGGTTVFDGPLCNPATCSLNEQYSLKLQNVAGGPLDEVVVDSYSGGAHCCFLSNVVLVDGPHAGRMLFRDWGDPGYRGELHNGVFDFVSADDRFAYAFTSFAGSGLPVQVWAIDAAGRFANVTSTRLDLVRADAKQFWTSYVSGRGGTEADVRGVVAAWCADEYLLGLKATCDSELAAGLAKGYLNGPIDWPRNAKFVKALKRSLLKWGYPS